MTDDPWGRQSHHTGDAFDCEEINNDSRRVLVSDFICDFFVSFLTFNGVL